MAMRVYVFDPGLNGIAGHHGHFAIHFPPSLERYGLELHHFGHTSVRGKFPKELKIVPHFRPMHYNQHTKDSYTGLFHAVTTLAREFAADIDSLKNNAPRDEDLVLLPTAGLREAMGLSMWMKARKRKPRVVMLFHTTIPWDRNYREFAEGTVGGLLCRLVGQTIAEASDKDRCLIAATNKFLAELFARPLGHGVRVLPAPIWYGEIPPDSGVKRNQKDLPVLSFLGDSRVDKGFDHIPAIVRKIQGTNLKAKSVIHVNTGNRTTPVNLSAYEALERKGLAKLVKGWIPDEQMNELIRSSSFVMMPYDREGYRTMLSGMFALVTAMGRPSIVPTDTWMADQIAAGRAAGVTFADDKPETIAEAVAVGLKNLPAIAKRAEELSVSWRRERSGDALVDKVMAWAGVKPKG